ncbi:MAG TPA: protease pro-enzyme activation domain-containing protein [Solirubrobacteraceae bacterium]
MSRWTLAAMVGASAMLAVPAGSAQAAAVTRAHAEAGGIRIGAAPQVPGNSQTLGALAAGAPLDVTVALAPRDPAALQRYATAVSTPGSAGYHRYLSVSDFRGRFAPTDAQIASVRSALSAEGLSPSAASANGLEISVDGTAQQFSRAFSVSFDQVRLAGGRVAYTNTAPPTLPSAVAPLVQDVVGLDSLQQVHSDALHRTRAASGPLARPRVATGGPQPCAAASGSGALTADQLASSYQFSSLYGAGDEGAGQTIALVEFEPDDPADIAGYAACYGVSTAGISDVTVDSGVGAGTGQGEAALDIEDVLGLAPQATILVYQSSNWFDAYNAVISQDRANVISTSWYDNCNDGAASSGLRQAENTLFQEAATQGESVYVAQGDSGSEACLQNGGTDGTLNVQDPGSQPFVTSVGGTAITALGPRPSETTYNDAAGGAGGGGISKAWTMPAYQSGAPAGLNVINANSSGLPCAATTGDCREIPDVSADASDLSPYAIYIAGGWHQFWGTSAAAPTWAAYTALVNASSACDGTAVGFANPLLYAIAANDYGNAFNDVTTGTNDLSGGQGGLFPAGAGYDMATGLGSPNGGVLAQDLCAARGSAVAVTAPGDQSDPIGAAVSLPIRASDATGARLSYAATGLPPGLSIDPATGMISGTTTAAADTVVTVTATDADHATGTTSFQWLVGGSANSRMTLSCSHPSVTQRSQIAAGDSIALHCTALVQRLQGDTGAPKPSGSVGFSVSPAGIAQPAMCTLPATVGVPNSCTTKLSATTEGSYTVTATYSGDSVYHGRTESVTLNLK